ncbi:MAG: Asp-tRNA(Asn)/Glu-tRNA(Gln) amidotransferase subunit GatA [Phycisphaerales bacterium]
MSGAADLASMSAIATRDAVRAGTLSARTVTAAALDRIAHANPTLNALLQVFTPEALSAADRIDAKRASGQPLGPLAGVPVALKDNICLNWGRTTCGCRMLEHYHSPFTATAAQRLIDADAVIIGKTNMDEFAMGSSTEHSAFGPTRNPHDHARVPGGSSGGSAAAVAAGLVPLALGSDTGGSVRQPASMCGIVGLKPTYGRVSRWGLVAYASSLDQIGPLARTVEDAALALSVIAGRDDHDETSAHVGPTDFAAQIGAPLAGLRIGVPREARSAANSPGVTTSLDHTIALLRSAGAVILDIDLPHTDIGIAAYYLIATAEASSNLARFDGIRFGRRAEPRPGEGLLELYERSRAEGLGPEVRRRIMLGTHALSSGYYDAYYLSALKVRRLIKQGFDAAFAKGCAAILTPTTPGPAFRIGEKVSDPLALYLEDVYTVGINLAGLPAISLPAGTEKIDGRELPLGLQLIGPTLADAHLMGIAAGLATHV